MSGDARDPLTLGVVLTVLGMGGTLATLYLFSLLMSLLKRLFPIEVPTTGPSPGRAPPVSPASPEPAAPDPQPPAAGV